MRAAAFAGFAGAALAGLAAALLPSASSAQDGLLDRPARLDVRDVAVTEALEALQRTSGVRIAFSPDLLPSGRRVSCTCDTLTVGLALERILDGTGLRARATARRVLVGRSDPVDGEGSEGIRLLGTVTEVGSDRGVPSAEIVLEPGGRRATAGSAGRFVVPDLAPGSYGVRVEALGYQPYRGSVTVEAGRPLAALSVRLERAPIELGEMVIGPGRFGILEGTPGASGAAVTREEIEAIPQFGDDVFRTLKRLPGVASDDVSTRLNVRGGKDRDLLFRLDGLELLEPYHLKDLDGALGIVDVQALEGIDLITGGFPTEFGDRLGGVFDMRSRRPPPSGSRSVIGMSLSSISYNGQGRFGDGNGQWSASLRRGFLDLVLDITDADPGLSPSYWDVFGRVGYLLSDGHRITFSTLYAGDDLSWSDDRTGSSLSSDWSNGYVWAGWQGELRGGVSSEVVLSAGRLDRDRTGRVRAEGDTPDGAFTPIAGDMRDESSVELLGARADLTWDLSERLSLKGGGEARHARGWYDFESRTARLDVDAENRLYVARDSLRIDTRPGGTEVGLYLAARGRLGGGVTGEAGIRWDRQGWIGEGHATPRLLLRWDVDPSTRIHGSVGRYAQSQGVHELQVQDGERDFTATEIGTQAALGLERDLSAGASIRVEAYHRTVDDPRPEWVNLARAVNPLPELEADRARLDADRARARGLELLLKLDGGVRTDGSVSYALAEAEQRIDGAWVPRTHDQRHTINLFGAWRPGPGWQVSGSWHYRTGWPVTDQSLELLVTSTDPDQAEVEVIEREFGPLNGDRLPPYHRLDLRVTRTFEVGRGSLELFLDVFNAYGRVNVRGYGYAFRRQGNQVTTVRDVGEEHLPLLPTVGFRWAF